MSVWFTAFFVEVEWGEGRGLIRGGPSYQKCDPPDWSSLKRGVYEIVYDILFRMTPLMKIKISEYFKIVQATHQIGNEVSLTNM